jgi:putative ATP-dependent endonuclease of OLD family
VIQRVVIQNYRRFRRFEVELAGGLNVVIGDNDVGKSTLLEAISVALTGRLNGRWLSTELSPYLVNRAATDEYVRALRNG